MSKDITMVELAIEKCCRCGGEGSDPHICPYRYELNGDDTTLCNCCEGCTQECAWDV